MARTDRRQAGRGRQGPLFTLVGVNLKQVLQYRTHLCKALDGWHEIERALDDDTSGSGSGRARGRSRAPNGAEAPAKQAQTTTSLSAPSDVPPSTEPDRL